MVAVLLDFLICIHLHCFHFSLLIPSPRFIASSPIVSPILHDSPPRLLSYRSRSIPPLLLCHLLSRSPLLSHSFPGSPVSLFSDSSWLTFPPFLVMDSSRISNAHCLLAYKTHVAGREGASLFLFVLQSLLTVQSTDKSCIFCYTAIHHFCCYTAERLPTCPYPAQWYCYLSCDLRGRLIYWDILVSKVYLVTKQVSR